MYTQCMQSMHLFFLFCTELRAKMLGWVEFGFEGDTFKTNILIYAFNQIFIEKLGRAIFHMKSLIIIFKKNVNKFQS